MRDINRIDVVCNKLNETWKNSCYMDMRFGQFMSNFLGWVLSEKKCSDVFFPEDDKWIEWLDEYKNLYKTL